MPSPILKLTELAGTQADVAGGKGASLGELVRAGARVPAGFVVLRHGFDAFMAAADPDARVAALLADIDAGRATVEAAASDIRQHLGNAPIPDDLAAAIQGELRLLDVPRVSVRSSATCEDGTATAWAGQLDTFLNVGPQELLSRVRACWLSIFEPRALAYGAAHGYGAGDFGVAVVVQEMVQSETSGIGFSVHPVTQEPSLGLIEACFGQGEAIVSGAIAPDQYVVELSTQRIVENTRGQQQKGLFLDPNATEPVWRDLGERGNEPKLTESQIAEYAAILGRIQAHYGFPVDTEWALADGSFHLLQARPITTLAPEYREAIVDQSDPWAPMVRRPLTLFEASLVGHWMDSEHMGRDFGIHIDRFLAIQDTAGLFNLFASAGQFRAAIDGVKRLERDDRPRLVEILKHAQDLYDAGRDRLERGETFDRLDEASEYFMEIGRSTTGFPVWTLFSIEELHAHDPEVTALAEGLRARSLYPPIAHKVVHPLVVREARALGFSDPERAAEVTTWPEARQGLDRDLMEERLERVRAGERVVYQVTQNEEAVRFVSETGYLLMRIAGTREIVPPDDPDRVSGQAAWPGVHRGRARVILSSDPEGYEVDDGDVIVSIQSNPSLMPLLRHAGAIVTDDGGVACHAAIICRELKIPTLIGTGRATSAIHDGDLVEVDATQQVVRVVERR